MTVEVSAGAAQRPERTDGRSDVALVDLLDRLLGAGVVLAGDVTISLAGVDLVQDIIRRKGKTAEGFEVKLAAK